MEVIDKKELDKLMDEIDNYNPIEGQDHIIYFSVPAYLDTDEKVDNYIKNKWRKYING